MDTALIITLVFSIITALLVVAELLLNFNNSKKERNNKSVTEQRAQWIQNLRTLFAEIIELLDQAIDSLIKFERKYNGASIASVGSAPVTELRKKFTSLRLLLNFDNAADKTIIKAIGGLICRIDFEFDYCGIIDFPDYYVAEYIAAKELIVLYMSIYLKSEWERLKKESKSGETSSKYFEDKYKELTDKNKSQIDTLSKKAYRITLQGFIEYLESFEEFKQTRINAYNCLNLYDINE